MQLTAHAGIASPASTMLFEAVRFAVAIAGESGGAFDPTVGHSHGVARIQSRASHPCRGAGLPPFAARWRDIVLDAEHRIITLHRPVLLELGAVAKGLAVDAAARGARTVRRFCDRRRRRPLSRRTQSARRAVVGWHRASTARRRADRFAACLGLRGVHIGRLRESRTYSRPAHWRARDRSRECDGRRTLVHARRRVGNGRLRAWPAAGIEFLERMGVEGLIVTPTSHVSRPGACGVPLDTKRVRRFFRTPKGILTIILAI